MKIKIIIGKSNDHVEWQEMAINGKNVCSVFSLCECPEDAMIGRGLISCAEIATYMRQAHEAGKNGEEFEIEEIMDGEEE